MGERRAGSGDTAPAVSTSQRQRITGPGQPADQAIQTVLMFTNSRMPYSESSRP